MIKLLTDFFVKYAKDTPPAKMVLHVLLFGSLISWLGVVSLVTLKFDTLVDIYDRHRTSQVVQVEEALQVSTQTNQLISEQRTRLGIDRLYVSKFHNGKVDLNGVHFIYFSRVAENTGPGVSNEISRTQNLPLSIFPEMLTSISNGACYYVEQVDQTVENSAFLGTMGVQSMLVCPIYDVTNALIGLIGADGVRNQINTDDVAELESNLSALSGVLGSLITSP